MVHPGEQERGQGLLLVLLVLLLLPAAALLEEAGLVLREEGVEEDEVVVLCVGRGAWSVVDQGIPHTKHSREAIWCGR